MKHVSIILFLFLIPLFSLTQTMQPTDKLSGDKKFNAFNFSNRSLIGKMGPSIDTTKQLDIPWVVNGFMIRKSRDIERFRDLYFKRASLKRIKFYSSPKAEKKFGITSRSGVLVVKMNKNTIMDFEAVCEKDRRRSIKE